MRLTITRTLVNRNFALTWIGGAISGLGDSVCVTTLVLWIAVELARGQSWAALAVSGIYIADSLSMFLLGPVAGVFADRWKNKRGIMMRMDVARASLLLLLFAGAMGQELLTPRWLLVLLYGLVFLLGLCTQFFNPLSTILFYDIVEEAYRPQASGLTQFTTSLIIIIGPALATTLFFYHQVNSLNLLCYCIFNASMTLKRSKYMDKIEHQKTSSIHLRDVHEDDLPIFFENQLDAEANYMAAFTAKDPTDRDAFMAHWRKILSDETNTIQTILHNGQVAGSISIYEDEGHKEVTYWLGKQYWGQGIATRALSTFLHHHITSRPLYARASKDNIASLRVLEKCGFTIIGEGKGFANARGREIEEFLLQLKTNV